MSTMNEELLLLHELNKKIVDCKLCPRLTKYIGEVGKHQTKRFINQVYWAKSNTSSQMYTFLTLSAQNQLIHLYES